MSYFATSETCARFRFFVQIFLFLVIFCLLLSFNLFLYGRKFVHDFFLSHLVGAVNRMKYVCQLLELVMAVCFYLVLGCVRLFPVSLFCLGIGKSF